MIMGGERMGCNKSKGKPTKDRFVADDFGKMVVKPKKKPKK